MDADLKKFEEELERLCPVAMPDGLIARMEAAMDGWQNDAAEEEKVVPFPGQTFPGQNIEVSGSSRRGFWAAAAAVAVLGALAALFVPSNQGGERTMVHTVDDSAYTPASFSPVGASRNILSASDEGFVMTKDAIPHRAVRVEYMDQIEFINDQGERLQVEAPRVRIVLIPVQVD